jgi:hypothetical protein
MSQATWLFSFARFLETIIYHSPVGCENGPYGTLRLFQRGATIVKICVAPLTVYRMEIEGPVVCGMSDSTLAGDAIRAEALDALRAEIHAFFASVEEAIAEAEASCIATTSKDDQDGPRERDTAPSAEGDADSDPLETLRALRSCAKGDESEFLASAQMMACELKHLLHLEDVGSDDSLNSFTYSR